MKKTFIQSLLLGALALTPFQTALGMRTLLFGGGGPIYDGDQPEPPSPRTRQRDREMQMRVEAYLSQFDNISSDHLRRAEADTQNQTFSASPQPPACNQTASPEPPNELGSDL